MLSVTQIAPLFNKKETADLPKGGKGVGKINYAFITMTCIAQAKIGLGLPWGISYAIGGILAVA